MVDRTGDIIRSLCSPTVKGWRPTYVTDRETNLCGCVGRGSVENIEVSLQWRVPPEGLVCQIIVFVGDCGLRGREGNKRGLGQ